jgi:hypothetical protein
MTFAALAKADLDDAPKLDGINVWPTLLDPTRPHRTEVLISDKILRVGRYKLVTGATAGRDPQNWWAGNLKGCMLGTGGGWMRPSPNRTANCPGDIYTTSGCATCLGCPQDERAQHPVTAPIDVWLCSDPCTAEHPCLWDLEADPHEREEMSRSQPAVVATMLARLRALQQNFANSTAGGSGSLQDNGRFCEVLNSTEVAGFGVFLAPWMPDS